MNLSEDWRFLFPVSAVFAAPSAAPRAAAASSRGPLHFSHLPPRTPLLSLPYPILPPRSSTRRLDRHLRSFARATSFLPRSDLDSLSETLLPQPSPPFSPPSNLIAVLRRPRLSSCSLILFFPYGENAEHVAFVTLDATTATGSTPVSPVVQRDGFMHPGQRIQQLATTVNEPSWPSEPEDSLEGFLLAVTMHSLNWFRVESRGLGTSALVPAAKQGFDSVIVHACWSRHLPSECIVLLESGELCWFNLDTRQGGKMKIDFGGKDDCGDWLSCDYGAQPWMVIVASSKSILLIDLRFGNCGECKVLSRVGMPGLFETDPFAGADQYLAFCRAGFDHFHFSVVTKRYLILLDVRQPLTPVLAWQHELESPNNVAMFRLSELRHSKEHEWASSSGFAILVGSFWTGEFSVFCYGPKEQGCPENSHLYAWDLPSRFSLTNQHCSCSNGIVKDVFSRPVSRDSYASQPSKNPTIGYYVLPHDLLVLEPSFNGFALICLKALGKLEMQRYRASASHDDIPCDESQHAARTSKSSTFPDTQCEDFPLRYSLMKLHFLSKYLEGNLCNALVKHDSGVNKQVGQIIVSGAVSEYAEDNSSSSSRSVSDFLCNASIPMNIFEIACQRILNSLPSNILYVTFSKYKDMLACSTEKTVGEHLDVPTCLAHDKLRPFLLAKPSSISYYLTSKVQSPDALVGPVLPIHVLLAMEEINKGIESFSEGENLETDSVSDQCREVLEAFDPVISITDTLNCDALQGLNHEKPYFSYEPQIEHRFTLDGNAGKEKEDRKLDNSLHTSATPYQDKIFTTFVCGKAKVPDSGPEQAATSLFDFGPVRMDFDTPGMEIHPDEEKVYKCLRKQFVAWQNNFKPYQDFCSSHKIQRLRQ
ncbi:hypothetical protein C2845_PM01G08800 [Panicum miliaceum]|uniref:TATA box-binding protein-associated factor RNA polymerase I subunit C n=1 Tax=Panicum miliaceum TaxID=4540 RepID=A0A3L6TQB5_PANMI|nr:hypothetical protein C2845_PM01G08800 [Panicum miliaceum]